MRRRAFITVLGGAAAWPLAAHAQRAAMPVIGFLGTATPSTWALWTTAFTQRLRELSWIEGRTITIEYRWAEGREERYAEIAAEFVRLKVDVIVTSGAALPAAKQVTSVIPIKRLEVLREVVPGLRRLAVIGNVGNSTVVLEMTEVQAAARTLDLQVIPFEVRRAQDIAPAFEALKDRADAVYVVTDPLVIAAAIRINTFAQAARLPTMHGFREGVEAAGFISYAPSYPDQFRRAADFVDKILRGAKPGDLPIEQPTKFDLVINVTTAKALGLTIPESLLLRANEVIE
jgi:putative ABC transport system substrate-binding protein